MIHLGFPIWTLAHDRHALFSEYRVSPLNFKFIFLGLSVSAIFASLEDDFQNGIVPNLFIWFDWQFVSLISI